jgi:hypothetical protein
MGTDKDRNSRRSKRCNTNTRYTPRNEWWDKECKKMIQEKTKQGKKWLQLKTRISWNTHINKRNQANKNQL